MHGSWQLRRLVAVMMPVLCLAAVAPRAVAGDRQKTHTHHGGGLLSFLDFGADYDFGPPWVPDTDRITRPDRLPEARLRRYVAKHMPHPHLKLKPAAAKRGR